MAAKYTRPSAALPHRTERITLTHRAIKSGVRVYAVGSDPTKPQLVRTAKDFGSFREAMAFMDAKGEAFEAQGFTRVR